MPDPPNTSQAEQSNQLLGQLTPDQRTQYNEYKAEYDELEANAELPTASPGTEYRRLVDTGEVRKAVRQNEKLYNPESGKLTRRGEKYMSTLDAIDKAQDDGYRFIPTKDGEFEILNSEGESLTALDSPENVTGRTDLDKGLISFLNKSTAKHKAMSTIMGNARKHNLYRADPEYTKQKDIQDKFSADSRRVEELGLATNALFASIGQKPEDAVDPVVVDGAAEIPAIKPPVIKPPTGEKSIVEVPGTEVPAVDPIYDGGDLPEFDVIGEAPAEGEEGSWYDNSPKELWDQVKGMFGSDDEVAEDAITPAVQAPLIQNRFNWEGVDIELDEHSLGALSTGLYLAAIPAKGKTEFSLIAAAGALDLIDAGMKGESMTAELFDSAFLLLHTAASNSKKAKVAKVKNKLGNKKAKDVIIGGAKNIFNGVVKTFTDTKGQALKLFDASGKLIAKNIKPVGRGLVASMGMGQQGYVLYDSIVVLMEKHDSGEEITGEDIDNLLNSVAMLALYTKNMAKSPKAPKAEAPGTQTAMEFEEGGKVIDIKASLIANYNATVEKYSNGGRLIKKGEQGMWTAHNNPWDAWSNPPVTSAWASNSIDTSKNPYATWRGGNSKTGVYIPAPNPVPPPNTGTYDTIPPPSLTTPDMQWGQTPPFTPGFNGGTWNIGLTEKSNVTPPGFDEDLGDNQSGEYSKEPFFTATGAAYGAIPYNTITDAIANYLSYKNTNHTEYAAAPAPIYTPAYRKAPRGMEWQQVREMKDQVLASTYDARAMSSDPTANMVNDRRIGASERKGMNEIRFKEAEFSRDAINRAEDQEIAERKNLGDYRDKMTAWETKEIANRLEWINENNRIKTEATQGMIDNYAQIATNLQNHWNNQSMATGNAEYADATRDYQEKYDIWKSTLSGTSTKYDQDAAKADLDAAKLSLEKLERDRQRGPSIGTGEKRAARLVAREERRANRDGGVDTL